MDFRTETLCALNFRFLSELAGGMCFAGQIQTVRTLLTVTCIRTHTNILTDSSLYYDYSSWNLFFFLILLPTRTDTSQDRGRHIP